MSNLQSQKIKKLSNNKKLNRITTKNSEIAFNRNKGKQWLPLSYNFYKLVFKLKRSHKVTTFTKCYTRCANIVFTC